MADLLKQFSKLPAEQAAIRAKCFHPTGTFVEFKKEAIEHSIPECFEKVVVDFPDQLAVKTNNEAITYQQLNKAANRVAHGILQRCGSRTEAVVLLCNHGVTAIVSCMAILKTGKVLVVADTSFPVQRIARIVEDCQAAALLTDNDNLSAAVASAKTARQVINVDDFKDDLSDENLRLDVSPETPAEIRYSSGSTGEPKGIVRNHRRLLHTNRIAINATHLCRDDRVLVLHSLSFGIRHITKALVIGATLCPFNIRNEAPVNLVNFIRRQEITCYASVPSTFRFFVSSLREGETLASLRLIHLGGESLSKHDVVSYKRHFADHCILVYRFSCAETGNLFQYFMDKETEISTPMVPVGYPVEGKEIVLLDEKGKEVGIEEVGEIAVRSRYLSTEYWRQPDLTRSKFLDDPKDGAKRLYLTGDLGRKLTDGRFVHLGRKDLEVKIRGCKFSVAEVETVLRECSLVTDVAVRAWGDGSSDQYLAAYVVTQEESQRNVRELRNFLSTRLSDYMIPSRFVFLSALPRTVSGKLDRFALTEPDKLRPELRTAFAAPRTPIERELSLIWSEVLSLQQVGIHDRFFDLGGHSLAASRIISRVMKRFCLELPLQSLFAAPTVAEMAAVIAEHGETKHDSRDLDRVLGELESLSDEEVQRLLDDAKGRHRV